MLLPGDKFQIYYDDWHHTQKYQGSTNVRIGSYRKVWIEVLKMYFDPLGDYAYICQRCDCKDRGTKFVLRLSTMTFC